MELELLKKSWESLDKRMQQTATFNQHVVESIISSRVITTVDKIKRLYTLFYVVLTGEILFLIALFAGNPFDFKYTLQFLPYVLLLIGIIIAFLNLLRISREIQKLSVGSKVDQYLKSMVSIYEQNKRFEKWFGIIFLSIGLWVVPLSFLPQKIERVGVWGALAETTIMISVTLVFYAVAFKMKFFKNPYRDQLEKELADWNVLNALAK